MEADGCHELNCDEQIGHFQRQTETNVLIKRALNQNDYFSIIEPTTLLEGIFPIKAHLQLAGIWYLYIRVRTLTGTWWKG